MKFAWLKSIVIDDNIETFTMLIATGFSSNKNDLKEANWICQGERSSNHFESPCYKTPIAVPQVDLSEEWEISETRGQNRFVLWL